MILLAAAVKEELSFWTPREGVSLLITGIGPVEASTAIAAELALQHYDLVLNAGVAGAFDGAAQIGDGVVVAEQRMELDLEDGAALALPDGTCVIDSVRSDDELVAKMRGKGFATLRGITVSRVTCSDATARRLRASGAQIESMEGFAVLRAAQRAGVAAIELRGISNRCGERAASGWDFAAGVAGLQRVIDALLEVAAEDVVRGS